MKNKKMIKNEKGFTLIEIIAVIIIMGILAAVAVPKFFSMQEDAKRATLNGGLSEASARFNHAYARFILDTKRAPKNIGELTVATYLGAASGAPPGEDIGDFLVTWTASGADVIIKIETAPGIITDWEGLDTARVTTISSITWYVAP